MSRFPTGPVVNGNVAASTRNQLLNVVLFLYQYQEVVGGDLAWGDDVARAKRRHSICRWC